MKEMTTREQFKQLEELVEVIDLAYYSIPVEEQDGDESNTSVLSNLVAIAQYIECSNTTVEALTLEMYCKWAIIQLGLQDELTVGEEELYIEPLDIHIIPIRHVDAPLINTMWINITEGIIGGSINPELATESPYLKVLDLLKTKLSEDLMDVTVKGGRDMDSLELMLDDFIVQVMTKLSDDRDE